MPLWRRKKRYKKIIKLSLIIIAVVMLLLLLLQLFGGEDQEITIRGDVVKIRLLQHESGKVAELGLEEYIVGVVAAEMPAAFSPEALKAQAVAARTYAVKRLQIADPRVNNAGVKADLSSDPAINQAWISTAEMKRRWGKLNYARYKNKITEAVSETKGEVLIYEGQLIDPAYHASCGGNGTENSENVWKYAIPYLRGVACNNHPQGNKEAVNVFKTSEINKILTNELPVLAAAKISANISKMKILEKTATGRIKTVLLSGQEISGTELRSKLGLPSTIFNFANESGQIKFTSRGYGHGVGMCQFGAGAMADESKNYLEILTHYYQGVKLAMVRSE